MRPLLTYIVTQSVLHRFERTLRFQQRYFPQAVEFYDRLVITDLKSQIDVGLPVVRGDICPGGKYSMPVARNFAFKTATDRGYDWHFDGDSDRVIADGPPKWTEPGLGCVNMHHFLKHETHEEVMQRFRDGRLQFTASSFFISHRSVFAKLKFCEEFTGYGFDDLDFVYNVCFPAGVQKIVVPVRGFHLWHEERIYEGFKHQEGLSRNEALYKSRSPKK